MSVESPKPGSLLNEAERALVLSSQDALQSGHTQLVTTAQKDATPKYNVIRDFWHMPPDRKSVVVSVLALAIAVIATIFTYGQYKAAKDSVIIAQKSLDVAVATLNDARAGAAAAEERAGRLTKANEELAQAAKEQAAATLRAVDSSHRSARAAEQSANLQTQSFQARERPQVFIKQANLGSPLTPGQAPVLDFKVFNSGPIEARGIFYDITLTLDMLPFTNSLRYKPDKEQVSLPFVLAPLAEGAPTVHFRVGVTDEQIKALESGNARLFFYGRGEYRDQLGRRYPLPFCVMYVRPENSPVMRMVTCPSNVTVQ